MIINLQFDASVNNAPPAFKTDVLQAAQFFESRFSDPITVTLSVSFANIDQTFPYGSSITGNTFSYAAVTRALVADAKTADDRTVIDNPLPDSDPTHGNGVILTRAQQKAFGLLPNDNTVDAGISFVSTLNSVPFNYNASQRAVAGKIDFIGVAESAIGTALGKFSEVGVSNAFTVQDLLRYAAPGSLTHVATSPAFFSLDGGKTPGLNNFNIPSQAAPLAWDWAASAGNDPFDATPPSGVRLDVSQTDLRELDALGYDRGVFNGPFEPAVVELGDFGTQGGFWSSENTQPRTFADVNGDGLADIVGFHDGGVHVALGTGGGHYGAGRNFVLADFGTLQTWSSQDTFPRQLADVNGDGLADIVGFASDGVHVALATGGGLFGANNLVLADFGRGQSWSSQDTFPRELADVNGDGLADIVGFASDGVYVALATGGGLFGAKNFVLADFGRGQSWSSQDTFPRQLADVNGDGLADIVGFASDGVYVSLATGGGHFGAKNFVLADFGRGQSWSSQDTFPRQLADVNGDGLADIVGFASDGVHLSLATGGGHFGANTAALAFFGTGQSWSSQNTFPRFLADINGDGRADIGGFASTGVEVSFATQQLFVG